jgi:hypothetical protein
MKNLCWIIFALVFSSGCSDFYHLHYRKLDKVPAMGERRQESGAGGRRSQERFSGMLAEKKNDSVVVKNDSVVRNDSSVLVREKSFEKIKSAIPVGVREKIFPKKQAEKIIPRILKKKYHERDKKVLIILGLLFLGFILISYGVGVMVAGILGASFLFILAGILIFLLGLLPFVGLISMAVGNSYQPSQDEFEEKGKRKKNK